MKIEVRRLRDLQNHPEKPITEHERMPILALAAFAAKIQDARPEALTGHALSAVYQAGRRSHEGEGVEALHAGLLAVADHVLATFFGQPTPEIDSVIQPMFARPQTAAEKVVGEVPQLRAAIDELFVCLGEAANACRDMERRAMAVKWPLYRDKQEAANDVATAVLAPAAATDEMLLHAWLRAGEIIANDAQLRVAYEAMIEARPAIEQAMSQ